MKIALFNTQSQISNLSAKTHAQPSHLIFKQYVAFLNETLTMTLK